jgi:hypothetical protein
MVVREEGTSRDPLLQASSFSTSLSASSTQHIVIKPNCVPGSGFLGPAFLGSKKRWMGALGSGGRGGVFRELGTGDQLVPLYGEETCV